MTKLPAKDCVVLVPCGDTVVTACEQSLRVLEQRGYTVRRVRGYAAIDNEDGVPKGWFAKLHTSQINIIREARVFHNDPITLAGIFAEKLMKRGIGFKLAFNVDF